MIRARRVSEGTRGLPRLRVGLLFFRGVLGKIAVTSVVRACCDSEVELQIIRVSVRREDTLKRELQPTNQPT